MTTPNAWTFDAKPGSITMTSEFGSVIAESRNEAYLLGIMMMAIGRAADSVALTDAIAIAWPEPVPPPGSVVITSNITITPDPA